MIFIVSKLLANFWFYQSIYFDIIGYQLQITGSVFIAPLALVIIDYISQNYGIYLSKIVIVGGIICDGIFSLSLSAISHLSIHAHYTLDETTNIALMQEIGSRLSSLFLHGVFAVAITSIIELLLFNKLLKKLKNFSFSSFLAILIVKSIHTVIVVSWTLHGQPNIKNIIIGNLLVNTMVTIIYILLIKYTRMLFSELKYT